MTIRVISLVSCMGLFCACHTHQLARDDRSGASSNQSKPDSNATEQVPSQPQVASDRPVRTTPNSMLGGDALRKVQSALNRHGESVKETGQLDASTESALR